MTELILMWAMMMNSFHCLLLRRSKIIVLGFATYIVRRTHMSMTIEQGFPYIIAERGRTT